MARVLEQARAAKLIGAGLDARVTLYVTEATDPTLRSLLDPALLRDLFIVSQVEVVAGGAPADPGSGPDRVFLGETGVPGLAVLVSRARGRKCARCWVWSEAVGQGADHPDLCERCLPIVRRMGAGSA